MAFSPQLRSSLATTIGHHAANELEESVNLTAGAVASQEAYLQQAAKMVELADRLDKLTIRVEHLERAVPAVDPNDKPTPAQESKK